MKKYRMLNDFYKWYFLENDESKIVILDNGKKHILTYVFTNPEKFPDYACFRVRYKNRFYYFSPGNINEPENRLDF